MTTIRTLIALLVAACSFTISSAQTAALKADAAVLNPAGGTVQLTLSASYDAQPGAIGWSVGLPKDWALASVAGPNVPAVAPQAGSAGELEFAYTSVPAMKAEFTLALRYPANAPAATIGATALIRTPGKLTTIKPEPVKFSGN